MHVDYIICMYPVRNDVQDCAGFLQEMDHLWLLQERDHFQITFSLARVTRKESFSKQEHLQESCTSFLTGYVAM